MSNFMEKTYILADPHFGHISIYENTRKRFQYPDNFEYQYINTHNSIVKPMDKVYIVGDVGVSEEVLNYILPQLNGKLYLISGNHDKFSTRFYLNYFEEVYGCLTMGDYIITHAPIHPSCKSNYKRNLHGHIHNRIIGEEKPDFFYRNVCLDINGYKPIDLELIMDETSKIIQLQGLERIRL